MTSWRSSLFRVAAFGAGVVSAVAVLALAAFWWSSRPKPWSSTAISAKPTELSFSNGSDSQVHFHFQYALTNNTSTEYKLPSESDGALMAHMPKDTAVSKESATWDGSIRIPPRQTVNVIFDLPFSSSGTPVDELFTQGSGDQPNKELVSFVNKRLGQMDGFVFYDYLAHYKINLPSNWHDLSTLQQQANRDNRPETAWSLVPPDQIKDWFNQVKACDSGKDLVKRCESAHIDPFKNTRDPWERYAFPNHLQVLPTPPKGFALDPNPSVCRIAKTWTNFCEAQVWKKP